ncbi:hypothetical protein T02_11581 [Trichinella nativa]|uniref:Uncharacterized protein n=1 Tax=Trichinella nativa TaxID=6335 RepID=A0A0V1KT16_9BILA|nr:hypothetical protein T02_11581 [Trichinella nativa]
MVTSARRNRLCGCDCLKHKDLAIVFCFFNKFLVTEFVRTKSANAHDHEVEEHKKIDSEKKKRKKNLHLDVSRCVQLGFKVALQSVGYTFAQRNCEMTLLVNKRINLLLL